MSWTHAICADCWDKLEPTRPVPDDERSNDSGETEQCAWCNSVTRLGLYRREDPSTVPFASS